jgi:hypothetical protein
MERMEIITGVARRRQLRQGRMAVRDMAEPVFLPVQVSDPMPPGQGHRGVPGL